MNYLVAAGTPPSCWRLESFGDLLLYERSTVFIHRQLKCRVGHVQRAALTDCVRRTCPTLKPTRYLVVDKVIASVGHGISPKNCRQPHPLTAVTPDLNLEGVVEMLGRDKVLGLLNKPAGFYPRVFKRVPVGQIPSGI